ncbi:MAG TPA: hypothetical protein VFF17_15885, partial [Thermoanaerobaculia bacterium]|nr:hypothetical protein [Thermoanaerobaculia bacterium]
MKLPRRLALCGLLLGVSAPAIASKAVFRQFSIPTPDSGPTSVLGTGFGILFTEFNANKIGFLTSDGRMLEYTIPTPNSGPMDLDIARDGTGRVVVWFTEFLANKIGRLNPHTGEFREYAIPTPASGPHSIVAGFSEVWFTEFHAGKIGRLTPDGKFTEFAIPTANSAPMGITHASSHGRIWFTEFLGNKLGYLPTAGGPIGELSISTPNSGPTDIHFAGDLRVFFTEFNAGKVAYVDHDLRTIVETPVPTASSGPYRICKSLFANREVWFTERSANQIGVIRANGSITEYELPAGQAEPLGCSYGLDQTWFTQRTPNALGWVHHDTSVVVGAGTVDAWETTFSYANAEPKPTSLFAGFYRDPPYGCAGSCPWQGDLDLPARGADSIAVPFPAGYALFSRSRDRGELPALRGRARYVPHPERATDLPAVRLSTINALDPQVLVFPGAMGSTSARSNLVLSNIWNNTSLFFSYETSLSVRIDVFSSEGTLLASETHGVVGGVFVDYFARLGIRELANGQIRVTKTGGGGLLWGTLTTLDGDAVVTDVGRNLSLP